MTVLRPIMPLPSEQALMDVLIAIVPKLAMTRTPGSRAVSSSLTAWDAA